MTRNAPPAVPGLDGRVLREYDVTLSIVSTVDNVGSLCAYCDSPSCRVAANVYLTTFDGEDHCLDVGVDCVFYVIDEHMDTDPDQKVTIEIAQGVRR